MTVTAKTAMLCDLIRQEGNGKFIAIGIYSATAVFASFPSASQFVLLCQLDSDSPGVHSFNFRVSVGDVVAFSGVGTVEVPDAQVDWLPIQLPPFQFSGPTKIAAEQEDADGQWRTFFSIAVTQGTIPTA